jgi:hypothetical protein
LRTCGRRQQQHGAFLLGFGDRRVAVAHRRPDQLRRRQQHGEAAGAHPLADTFGILRHDHLTG